MDEFSDTPWHSMPGSVRQGIETLSEVGALAIQAHFHEGMLLLACIFEKQVVYFVIVKVDQFRLSSLFCRCQKGHN